MNEEMDKTETNKNSYENDSLKLNDNKSMTFQEVFQEYFTSIMKNRSINGSANDSNNQSDINDCALVNTEKNFQTAYEKWLSSYEPKIL